MSDKPDPLHLGGGPTSPIWLQQSAKAWGGFCPSSPACSCPSPACSAFIFPLKEGAPGFSQLQDSPFFIALAFSPAIPFAPLSSTDVLSRRPLGTALFIHCLPTPPRSCPHWGTDPPIVSSCPVSHLLESRGTRQPPPPTFSLSYFPCQTLAFCFSLQAEHSNLLWWVRSAQVGDGWSTRKQRLAWRCLQTLAISLP